MSGAPADVDDLIVRQDGSVLRLTINRPDRLNAMGPPQVRQLVRELLRAWRSTSVRSVVITGAGRGFCTGHDLEAAGLGAVGATAWNDLFAVMAELPKPIVAAVNGPAAGGGLHLALACDLAYCVDDAVILEPFVGIGACADTGGHLFLQRSVGHQRAAEMLLLGDRRRGDQLCEAGLFSGSFATVEELLDASHRTAERLATGPPLAQQVTRRGLEFARLHPTPDVLTWEAREEERMARSDDMSEGVEAFLARRAPDFRGR